MRDIAALSAAVVLLVLTNLVNNRWLPAWGLLTAVVVVTLLLGIAHWAGDGAELVGLTRGSLPRGARDRKSVV